MDCLRCGGEGKLVQYNHVLNGICFRCWGSGYEPISIQELEAWLERARKEYRKRRANLKIAPKSRQSFLQTELELIERMGKAAKERLRRLVQKGSRCKKIATFPVATFHSYTSDREYEIREAADKTHLYCSCPAWKFQKKPVTERTCKHLQAFLKNCYTQERKGPNHDEHSGEDAPMKVV